jgi:hypothetical protein
LGIENAGELKIVRRDAAGRPFVLTDAVLLLLLSLPEMIYRGSLSVDSIVLTVFDRTVVLAATQNGMFNTARKYAFRPDGFDLIQLT